MKKLVAYAACMLIVLSVAATPDSKTIRLFNQTFPNAQGVKWYDNTSGYYAYFTQNGYSDRALFNKNGEFVCSWKYGDEKILPTNIIMTVTKRYGDAKIFGAVEYTEGENMSYDVKVSKGAVWYSVSLLPDGTIASEQKYKSADSN
jgi:hypothetical protein